MADNVAQFRAALQSSPPGRSHIYSDLAIVLNLRFEQQGVLSDLDEAIELYRTALHFLPPNHSERFASLSNLAASLYLRFKQRSVLSDLDEAIELNRAALHILPLGHSNRIAPLSNLAVSLRCRFEQRGVLSDLDEVIELDRATLHLLPPGHSNRIAPLSNLAVSLRYRFEQRGVLSDLDEAIELDRAALHIPSPDHSERLASLRNLAISLRCRFEQRNVLSDLDESIELDRAALHLLPPDYSERLAFLSHLAINLRCRFEQRSVLSDLDEAIELDRAALHLLPPDHSDRFIHLSHLAISLHYRFGQRSVLSDLDEAIELNRVAFLLPSGHSHRSTSFNRIAAGLRDRFKQRGVPSDLDEAIKLTRAALLLCPPGHSDRFMSLNSLALGLRERFQQQGAPSDLDEAIESDRAALLLCPPGHTERFASLNNLALGLVTRFRQQGVTSDLDEAIELNRDALSLCPPDHFDRSMSLDNLAMSLAYRFKQRGIPSDLDESIEFHRAALFLRPDGHSGRPSSLHNLAHCLENRFELRGVSSDSDLDEAIEHNRDALLLRPHGHSDRPTSLNNVASNLLTRFEQRGVLSDLHEAIELHGAALHLCPHGHPDRPMSLNNLAVCLEKRFKQRGVPSDVDEAIKLYRAALHLLPPDHSDRSGLIINLANCLRARFTTRLKATHLNTSFIAYLINRFTTCLKARFKQWGISSDLDEAFQLFLQLSHLPNAASRTDLSAAKSWVASADILNHDSALLAYKTALKFLDQRVALLSSSSDHFDVIREAVSSLATDAFSCSVRHGALMTAVELVEQGRAVFWTQLARFRSPLDRISLSGETGVALAEEFKRLSFRLRNAFDQSTADQSPEIRQLTTQWDDVVSRIRMLPDFSRFLLPPLFSDLQKVAEAGPVVIVNASRCSCDALIILSGQDPVHVPLDIAQIRVSELSSKFQSLSEQFGSSDNQHRLVGILRKLWEYIVHPIVKALEESEVSPGSRIWWCPTAEFTLLPLHAAGPYEKHRDNLSDIYISSYTPTLATLIRARQQVSQDVSPQHFVAIGQGNPDNGKKLSCIAPELKDVARRLEPIVTFTSLEDSDATVQGALDALNHNQWLHLACHGTPNRTQPFESSFAMRDGPLMIKDIIRSDWQNPEFAFLSACHTAVGDEKSPDELIHLAAAMQFSGFRSVIGSMWSVDDEVARQVVSTFYRYLVDGSGRLDCTRAAVALHKTMKSLRKKIPLEQQIVFVHIGV